MKVYYKSKAEIDWMQTQSFAMSLICSKKTGKPGVSTAELNEIPTVPQTSRSTSVFARRPLIRRSFCTSIDNVVVHGIRAKMQSDRRLHHRDRPACSKAASRRLRHER